MNVRGVMWKGGFVGGVLNTPKKEFIANSAAGIN